MRTRTRTRTEAEKGAINFNISPADRHLAKKEETEGESGSAGIMIRNGKEVKMLSPAFVTTV